MPATAGISGQPALAGEPGQSVLAGRSGWPGGPGSADVPGRPAAESGCCWQVGSSEEAGTPLSRATNRLARTWSAVPANPAARSPRARAEMCWSAAITAAGGRSRPASAAVPACSSQRSTQASRCACSCRFPAARGSAASTARRAAARTCDVVCPGARTRMCCSTAAAWSSSSPIVSSAMTPTRGRSITPASSARAVRGRRRNATARSSTRPAPRPVSVNRAAISASVCSAACGFPSASCCSRRRIRSLTAASSSALAHDDSRRPARITPASSSSVNLLSPAARASSAKPASTAPGDSRSAASPAANPGAPARSRSRRPACDIFGSVASAMVARHSSNDRADRSASHGCNPCGGPLSGSKSRPGRSSSAGAVSTPTASKAAISASSSASWAAHAAATRSTERRAFCTGSRPREVAGAW